MQLAGLFWVVSVSSVIGLPLLGFPQKKTISGNHKHFVLKKILGFWDGMPSGGEGCLLVEWDANFNKFQRWLGGWDFDYSDCSSFGFTKSIRDIIF